MNEAIPAKQPTVSVGRQIGIIAVIIAILSLLGLLGYGLKVAGPTGGLVSVQQGPARPFTLSLFDGSKVSLNDLKGKVVVLNFWGSWCVPCQAEAPVLERTARAYRDKGVLFVGIDTWDNEADARAFISQYGITYANGLDDKGQITIDYGVSGVPETYFIDRNGQVVRKYVGPMSDAQLTGIIEDLLKTS
jgi:cytochrome c biogenesis protein CcmG/thiol:disulfide interchange protein DsbE